MREMEARQNEAIDAALDVTGSSSKGAVKLVEEACWGSVMEADKEVSRMSKTSVRRMKREAEKRDERIDGLDALLKKILEKLTVLDGTRKDVQK